jgi:hypothetical protein
MNSAELSAELRSLIDDRLDAIERVLLQAGTPRAERQSIIAEVETQIFELLARRDGQPLPETLHEVLASLDAPESFLPEEGLQSNQSSPTEPPASRPHREWFSQLQRVARRTAVGAGWTAGLLVVNGVLLSIAVASDGVIPWIVLLAALAWVNFLVIHDLRRWLAEHRGHRVDTVCNRLAAWLTSRSGASAT